MKYKVEDEFEGFDFQESYVKDVEPGKGYFHIWLDNVRILPENSCNRDIRTMRTNNLLFAVRDMQMVSVVREGVKIYDADGRPAGERPDEYIAEEYGQVWPLLLGGCVYSIVKGNVKGEDTGGGKLYTFVVDTDEGDTYEIKMAGSGEQESWDLFLSL